MTTLAHISDLHFGCEVTQLVDGILDILDIIQPELLIISGDITQRARKGEFLAARAFLDSLPWRYLVIAGNHDIPAYNLIAQRTGIPVNADEALHVALNGEAQPVDAGYVNDLLFINTSSVGAYPVFVRSRNYLENRMHYVSASVLAGFKSLVRFRLVRVHLADRQLRTPLVFIGVSERELYLPALGQVKKSGQAGLHLFAVDCKSKMKVVILVMKSFFLGVDPLKNQFPVENQLVHDIVLNFPHRKKTVIVALDGELHHLRTPLKYQFAPGEFRVALPKPLPIPTDGPAS